MTNFGTAVQIHRGKATPERFRIKKMLRDWGQTAKSCEEMQQEIKRMTKLLRSLEGETCIEPKTKERLGESYRERIAALEQRTAALLKRAEDIERMVDRLEPEYARLLRLRFQNGMSVDGVSMRLYISRATCFRYQDDCLKKLEELAEDIVEKE